MEEEFMIPIDDAIKAFKHHLDAHDRTILSARFGDGKSYFLSHFMEDEDVAEHYIFLTLFPVNYQVTENRDIFELIKRDILLQMLLKGVIEAEGEISDEIALALFLQNKPLGFAESFLPLLSALASNDVVSKGVTIAQAVIKFLRPINKKINEIKNQSRDNQLEAFFNAVEYNPVIGQDAISCLIQDGLQQYKEKNANKQVVLVIEDLDRIDPAHLFRILNVFSAHIDFCYRMGHMPDETLAGNKFGLDKVVFVMHYENVRHIYGHFYGQETDLGGYIEKFCSSNHFTYSLEEQRDNYFFRQMEKETGLNINLLNYFLKPGDFKNISVRKVVHAIMNTDDFVIGVSMVKNKEGKNVRLHPGMLRLIAILRKIDISDSEIINRLKNAIDTKDITRTELFMYLAPYLCLVKYNDIKGNIRYTDSIEMPNMFYISDIQVDGRAHCIFRTSINSERDVEENLLGMLKRVLLMVSR